MSADNVRLYTLANPDHVFIRSLIYEGGVELDTGKVLQLLRENEERRLTSDLVVYNAVRDQEAMLWLWDRFMHPAATEQVPFFVAHAVEQARVERAVKA